MEKLGVDESETSIDFDMSLADIMEHLGFEAEDDDQIRFEEEGIMSLPNQVDTNDWIMKQTSPKRLGNFPQASTSSGINPNTALNANFGSSIQLRTPKALSISEDGTKVPIIAKTRAQNKKEIDRKHREKVKENIKRTKDEKHKLHNANGLLEIDNESLRRATNTTNESLQKATSDKQKLDEDICKLKHDTQNLQHNVNLYSNQLVKSNLVDHQSELIQLQNQISILKEPSNRNTWVIEKQQLDEKIKN
ncbi:hypothetical protein CFOL_v3_24438 [Cephalotus follicularis]|uniref:Uncharacterized protein n=1 Tax=Cephalotus follicularis TaxID=3775 RepID=A0A1Q3CL48_CEPFO|nr:hypothetical protein CFOL_v3_24438 [Cephalotus follicularis]